VVAHGDHHRIHVLPIEDAPVVLRGVALHARLLQRRLCPRLVDVARRNHLDVVEPRQIPRM
jgi:hypothetical protein